jgi:hypothetical protein
MGEYIPQAPINDEAKRYNGNLPGMGGVYNYVNLHAYHYAGNNPVKLKDPNGTDIRDLTDQEWTTVKESLDIAISGLDDIIQELNDFSNGKISSLSSNTVDAASTFLGVNFRLPGDVKMLSSALGKIRDGLASMKRENFKYDDFTFTSFNRGGVYSVLDEKKANSVYAYTNIITGTIYLGKKFFSSGMSGNDTRPGILIHEKSHQISVLFTLDIKYGVNYVPGLSSSGIINWKASNADNWEYFYEHIKTRGQ